MSGAPISWAQYCQVTPGVTWQYCAQLIGPQLIGPQLIGPQLIGARLIGPRRIGARLIGARRIGPRLIGPRLIGARHLLDSIGSLRAAEERGHPRGDKHRTSCHGETVAASPEEVGSHACL